MKQFLVERSEQYLTSGMCQKIAVAELRPAFAIFRDSSKFMTRKFVGSIMLQNSSRLESLDSGCRSVCVGMRLESLRRIDFLIRMCSTKVYQ